MCSPTDASLSPSRTDHARLGADVVRYSVIVSDLHRLLVAGLPAHCEKFWTLPTGKTHLAIAFGLIAAQKSWKA